jgi:hypothetical protein
MNKHYINPACKVLTLNTKRAVLEMIVETSDSSTAGGGAANYNPMEFDDAVDEMIFGKKEK